MPHFVSDDRYPDLLADLREAALAGDWRSALAEVLACADVLPECCRADFVGQAVNAAQVA